MMAKEKFCQSCCKWRLVENGSVVKCRKTSRWQCAFCAAMAKQVAERKSA